jgi:GNAT superfamily N-acetyltransferase
MSGIFGQFAVHPSLQKHGIGSVMMDLAEAIAAHNDAKELALDTSEQALHLIDYYQKRGYEFREYVQWDITNYRSIIVSKRLG